MEGERGGGEGEGHWAEGARGAREEREGYGTRARSGRAGTDI